METDYISRSAAVKALRERYANDQSAIGAIYSVPAADVRSVVYCVDCRYWVKQKASVQGYCKLSGRYPSGGWWCADGDRREGGSE